MSEFVHLHLHTQYSFLDGAIRVGDLFPKLAALGMKAVAITDHGNMFGAVDFYKRAKKAGIKPILGVEAYVAEGSRKEKSGLDFHLVLLAKNDAGYANLRRLVSFAWLEGMHTHPRIDLELLRAHAEGLFCLSGGPDGQIGQAVLRGRMEQAKALAKTYRDLFEPGAFHLEIQATGLPDQLKINAAFREIGRELEIPLCASNDVHYLHREDARAHEVLLAIQEGRPLNDPRRAQTASDAYWLKPADEMWRVLGAEFADALERTTYIADACKVDLDLGKVYLPSYPLPAGYDLDSYLAHRAREGLEQRFAEFAAVGKSVDKDAYHARLEEEVGIIIKMGFPGYFLIVQDFINWAKDHGIPVGPGRGSGAGSLAAYALRITDLDPIPYGLLFERFLNPERVSMPDFDVDFCMNRRGEVIQYVTHKYGDTQVGQIATFGGLKARGVIKDVGRALGLNFSETDRLSKLVPAVLNITLKQAIEQEPRLEKLYKEDAKVKDLLDIALSLEGLYRQAGMHAAGVVIGDKPLWDYCPVFTGANGELVTQFAKDEVEAVGLVKFDFLGLKTLTVIDDAVRMINRGRPSSSGTPIDLTKLSLDDPKVYELISRADTEGVFQLESSGFRELLKKLKPDKFEDIVAAVALYRPGPLNSGMLDDFIARKHGRQRIQYPHASLEPILRDTYGVIVYQEQVMQIAQVLAGFSLGGADLLRRAMGKKKADVMAAQREIFVKGAVERQVDAAVAGDIFDLMEKFAEYGFNKSHSAAYALITYHTGWLKAHHPVEFAAALLTSDRDSSEKVAKQIRAARHQGLEVLPPDVNRSAADFDAVDGKVLFGMAGVKGVGAAAVDPVVEARADGPFTSLFDFCERVDLRRVTKKTVEALVKSGAFDAFGEPRARLAACLDLAFDRGQQVQRDKAAGQASLFDLFGGGGGASSAPKATEIPREIADIGEWPERELLAYEKEYLGFYVSGHPLDRFRDQIKKYASATVEQLPRLEPFSRVTLAGIVSSVRVRPFRSGDGRMAIIQFEDLTGGIEIIAMNEDFDRYEELLTGDEPLLVTGQVRIDREEDDVKVSVRLGARGRRGEPESDEPQVLSLANVRAERARRVELQLPTRALTGDRLERLRAVLTDARHAGRCDTFLRVRTDDDCEVLLALPAIKLSPGDELQHAVQRLFDGACTLRTN